MKIKFASLLLILTGWFVGILAQEPPAPYPNQTERYCKVIVTWAPADGSGNRVCGAMLDYGNPLPRFRSQRRSLMLRDSKEQVMRFSSPIDILNYMNSLGWNLVHAFEHGEDDIRYLMRKPVTSAPTAIKP